MADKNDETRTEHQPAQDKGLYTRIKELYNEHPKVFSAISVTVLSSLTLFMAYKLLLWFGFALLIPFVLGAFSLRYGWATVWGYIKQRPIRFSVLIPALALLLQWISPLIIMWILSVVNTDWEAKMNRPKIYYVWAVHEADLGAKSAKKLARWNPAAEEQEITQPLLSAAFMNGYDAYEVIPYANRPDLNPGERITVVVFDSVEVEVDGNKKGHLRVHFAWMVTEGEVAHMLKDEDYETKGVATRWVPESLDVDFPFLVDGFRASAGLNERPPSPPKPDPEMIVIDPTVEPILPTIPTDGTVEMPPADAEKKADG